MSLRPQLEPPELRHQGLKRRAMRAFSLRHNTVPSGGFNENWDNAELVYWGVLDLVEGNGTQRGYYVNQRANGDRDCGTFEGKVTTVQGQTTLEGTWQAVTGTGKFAGVKAGGTYQGRMTSLNEVEMSWEGRYELAASARAA